MTEARSARLVSKQSSVQLAQFEENCTVCTVATVCVIAPTMPILIANVHFPSDPEAFMTITAGDAVRRQLD